MDSKKINMVISTKEGLNLKKLNHMKLILKKMKDICSINTELELLNSDYLETNNMLEVPNINPELKNFVDKIVQLRQDVFNLEFNAFSNTIEFEKIIEKYEKYLGIK